MRIIAGRNRGARLVAPRGLGSRPMLDRVRTALFDVLGDMEGLRVLDLFAGTGSLGLEALSRGAASCLFVESSRPALTALEKNVEQLRLADRVLIARGDVFHFLRVLEERFDLVFFDPPYAMFRGSARPRTLEHLGSVRRRNLAPGGRLVLHVPSRLLAEEEIGRVGTAKERAWGSSAVFLFEAPR
jgi:16S rRNA (guanine(966)-N(2))-methyltransferase RsmD